MSRAQTLNAILVVRLVAPPRIGAVTLVDQATARLLDAEYFRAHTIYAELGKTIFVAARRTADVSLTDFLDLSLRVQQAYERARSHRDLICHRYTSKEARVFQRGELFTRQMFKRDLVRLRVEVGFEAARERALLYAEAQRFG